MSTTSHIIRYSAESVVGSDFSDRNLCHASKINFGPSAGMLVPRRPQIQTIPILIVERF